MFGLQDESTPWRKIAGYTNRALAMLASRKPRQRKYGGLLVTWLLDEVLPQLHEKMQDDAGETIPVQDPPSVNDLVSLRHQVPIDGLEDFPDATWSELLAAYALDRFGQAQFAFQLKRDRLESAESGSGDNDQAFAQAMDRKFLGELLEAIDAVTYAEHLREAQDDAVAEADLLFSRQQRDKALKKHQPTKAAKEEFYLFWAQREFKNKSEAARRFLWKLEKENRNPFKGQPENTVTTLIRALRDWLKEKSDAGDDEKQ